MLNHKNKKISRNLVTEDGFCVGRWIDKQRNRKSELSNKRIKLLESLPNWSWKPHSEVWDFNYNLLKDYEIENGSVDKIKKEDTYRNHKLGSWCHSQRSLYKDGKLSQKRINILNKIVGWVWNKTEASFENGLAELKKYYEINGNTKVKSDYITKDGFKL